MEVPQAAVAEAGDGDRVSAVVAVVMGRAGGTETGSRVLIPIAAGVAEGETVVGAIRASALTVVGIQAAADVGGTLVCAGGLIFRRTRSTAGGAVVAAVGLSVVAVLVPGSTHLADGHEESGRGQEPIDGRACFLGPGVARALGHQVAGLLTRLLFLMERRKTDC